MSNPYDQILRSSVLPKPQRAPVRESQPSSSSVLSRAKRTRAVPKPPIRFNVRPRFRFDLPDPPMDPKMLLGRLSTGSFANPVYSDIEKDFRPPAIPADPKYGLRPNLVENALYRNPNEPSMDDNALLYSVMAGRPGYNVSRTGPISGRRGSRKIDARPTPQKPVTTNPFLRAMSYDEYQGSSSVTRHMLSAKDEEDKAAKLANDMKNDPKFRERRRRAMLHSFEAARQRPVHPDRRKAHLKPVHIAPVLPDFQTLGQEFVAIEFDKDDDLTHPERLRESPEAADESERTLTVVPVVKKDLNERTVIACYTPSERAIARRKRLREEEDGPMNPDRNSKKIHYDEEETYDWFSEYAIRETRIGNGYSGASTLARSCYAAVEYKKKENPRVGVVVFSRIDTSWKLSKRPGTMEKLGMPGLKLKRDGHLQSEDTNRRDLIAGRKVRSSSKK